MSSRSLRLRSGQALRQAQDDKLKEQRNGSQVSGSWSKQNRIITGRGCHAPPRARAGAMQWTAALVRTLLVLGMNAAVGALQQVE